MSMQMTPSFIIALPKSEIKPGKWSIFWYRYDRRKNWNATYITSKLKILMLLHHGADPE